MKWVTNPEWLLEFLLHFATRHRHYVALVMVVEEGEDLDLKEILRKEVRDSDALFHMDDYSGIIMGQTDTDDAKRAVERYRVNLDGHADLRFSVVTYPEDSRGADDMWVTARRRLEVARRGDLGHVIADG